MKLLRTLDLDALPPEKRETLTLRQAVRAVIFDNDKNIALLHVTRDGYYKIPGGGVEPGEDLMTALIRECREESGCDIQVDQEIGMTVEYRAKFNVKQESYNYLAHLVGSKNTPSLTQQEQEQGFETLWVPLNEAIRLVSEANTETYMGKFVTPRELIILQEAERLISGK